MKETLEMGSGRAYSSPAAKGLQRTRSAQRELRPRTGTGASDKPEAPTLSLDRHRPASDTVYGRRGAGPCNAKDAR